MAIRAAEPGTVSHGTLRSVDLIPAFLEVLQECNSPAWEQLQMQPHPLPPSYALEDPNSDWWNSEEADYFMEELFDALDACAPEGHYFGAHEGDASDFGFWPVPEEYEGNARRYWTVVIPYSKRPTKWHPTEKTGPFSTLTRGAFPSPQQAEDWARRNLAGQPYRIEKYQSPFEEDENLVPSEGYEGNEGQGRYTIQVVYSDPSAAHERANRLKSHGAYRVRITPQRGRYLVEASFRSKEEWDLATEEHEPNVRGGGKKSTAWSPAEELWRRREVILPNESDSESELEDSVIEALYSWHGGQGSAVYSLASTGHESLVSRSMIDAALPELESAVHSAKGKDKKQLKALIGELQAIRSFASEFSAGEAGMDIEEYEYDTWSEWTGSEMEGNQSRRERTRAALAGEPESGIDEHAAKELELYLDNDSRFSMDAPSGIGYSVRENMLRLQKRGKYNHALAPKGWLHVVDAAAQSYAREFDDAKRWHVIFNAPTRRAVAKSMADEFRDRVQEGETWGAR